MANVPNPFDNVELRVPMADWEYVRRFTSTFKSEEDRTKTDPDRSPFRRYVDLWWAGMCVGIREGRQTDPGDWHAFSPGVVLSSDPWRIAQLNLTAIAVTDDPLVVNDPGMVVAIANRFAATGIPMLIDVMTGDGDPIWEVSHYLNDLTPEIDELQEAGNSESGELGETPVAEDALED